MNESAEIKKLIAKELSSLRNQRGITKYYITKETELRIEIIRKIEKGEGYTIDSLLKYLSLQGIYLFFGDKSGNIYNPGMYINPKDEVIVPEQQEKEKENIKDDDIELLIEESKLDSPEIIEENNNINMN